MPDISMCSNEDCPKKEKCYRFTATPNPHRQAYQSYKWNNGCKDFWDNSSRKSEKINK